MRARSIGVLLVGLAACGGHPAHRPLATSPVPRPDEVILEVTHGGGDAALLVLHDALPSGSLREAAPTAVAEAVRGACRGLPGSVAVRARQSPAMRVVVLRGDGLHRAALGVRVRVDAGEKPLGAAVTLGAEDADGVRLVELPTAPGAGVAPLGGVAMALRGDVLVCANTVATLRGATPYLARTLLPTSAAPGVSFLVPEGRAASDLRAWLDDALAQLGRTLHASARAALAAHDTAPALGDPVVFVDALVAHATALVAYVPDLGVIEGQLAPRPEGLHLTVRADLVAGSPLAGVIATLPTFPRTVGAGLPSGTALGVVVGDAHGSTPTWPLARALVGDLSQLAGARLSPAVRDGALADVVAAFAAARGDATLVSLGHDGRDPFLVLGAHDSTTPPTSSSILAAARAPFLASLAGGIGGCRGDATAATNGPDTVELCGVQSAWRVARGENAWAAQVGPVAPLVTDLDHLPAAVAPPTVAAVVARALGGHDAETLGAQPDSARALASLPATPLLLIVVSPPTLAAALQLFDPDREGHATPPPQPVFVALSRNDTGLALDVIAPPHALAPLVAVIAALGGE